MSEFLHLRAAYLEIKAEIDAAIARVLDSGWYILSVEVENFEAEFAQYCHADHCVGVANGLDALILALRALGVGAGDEVIVPSNIYIATWLAVPAVGATIVPVEPNPLTHNIDPSKLSAVVTPRTKAILPVHLYGQPAELDGILAVARDHGIFVVEDAAQCHGARYKGRRIGAHGDIVCWSFYPGKNLGAMGDGGAITTDRADLADRVRVLRNYGSWVKYVNEVKGVNSRLDPIQAAVLRVRLEYLDEWNGRRGSLAARYDRGLANSGLLLPAVADGAEPVWHLYVVRDRQREALQERLTAAGIGTLIHYPIPPHRQQTYATPAFASDQFPIANQIAEEVISLPIGPHLTASELDDVIAGVRTQSS